MSVLKEPRKYQQRLGIYQFKPSQGWYTHFQKSESGKKLLQSFQTLPIRQPRVLSAAMPGVHRCENGQSSKCSADSFIIRIPYICTSATVRSLLSRTNCLLAALGDCKRRHTETGIKFWATAMKISLQIWSNYFDISVGSVTGVNVPTNHTFPRNIMNK